MAMERTYIMLKPDCVKRGLMGEVISRIERKNYKIVGPVLAMIVEGDNAVKGMRIIMGATKFEEATAGTIRGDYACCTSENLIHGSDSVENAEIEIKRFFG